MINIPHSIFREYDIRGIAGKDLSPEFAEALGYSYAVYLKQQNPNAKKVTVGRDCRISSPAYCEAVIRGIIRAGIVPIELGICTSPITYFSVFHLKTDGGIMITGSHNPSDYNGFKICVGTNTLHGEQIQVLKSVMEKLVTTTDFSKPVTGPREQYSIMESYIQYLLENTVGVKPKKIVIDAGNATASIVAPELFQKLGAQVIPLFCEYDGNFPNHHPDPTVAKNLKTMIETVLKEKADFGLAFDGDSDRIGVVDEKGRILFGDELMVILSREVLSRKKGATIISEVKSSNRLYDDIRKHGGRAIMWKTGHSLIKSKMKEEKAELAGEMSGHIFFADRYLGFDDAIYAAMRFYEIASRHTGPVSSLIADLPPAVATPEIRVDCEESLKFQLVEKTKSLLSKYEKITDIDGIRLDFSDGWGLIRASNTQPVIVLRFEAVHQQRLLELQNLMQGALVTAAKEIGHPPLDLSGE